MEIWEVMFALGLRPRIRPILDRHDILRYLHKPDKKPPTKYVVCSPSKSEFTIRDDTEYLEDYEMVEMTDELKAESARNIQWITSPKHRQLQLVYMTVS